MSTATRRVCTLVVVLVSLVATAFGAVDAGASEPPIEEVPQAHLGREVNVTKTQEHAGPALEDVCLVLLPLPGETCEPGKASLTPGGFTFPNSVAGAPEPSNDVYVTDAGNRVQEFTPAGEVVRVFGSSGTGAGQFKEARGIAVDQTNGDTYVRDFLNWRVEKFTSTGTFVLMFGKEVNTDGSDICTAGEGIKCKAGVQGPDGGKAPSQFNFTLSQFLGDVLAVGPGHVIYVADEHRVQEFEENGTFKGEISLSAISSVIGSQVTGLAVDGAGDVYVVYSVNSETRTIRKFGPGGVEIQGEGFPLTPVTRQPGGGVNIEGLALDGAGRLAVAEREHYQHGDEVLVNLRGELYETDTGEPSTSFPDPGSGALGFSGSGELYAAGFDSSSTGRHEVWKYIPLDVARLKATEASCVPGVTHGSTATLDCELKGTVNPWGVDETEVWFDWGRTAALGTETLKQPIPIGEEPVEVHAVVEGVRPNESGFFYELVGTDANVRLPETIKSNLASFTTPIVTPWLGEPAAPFVRAGSAVLFEEVNPEHARTRYQFEYLPCSGVGDGTLEERWAESERTQEGESSAYGQIGTTREIAGLQADTTYCYRLHAHSESTSGGETKEVDSEVESFKTAPPPRPRAITGAASGVGMTSAQISGSVDPDGAGALYSFEVGVYNGADTNFGVVYSSSASGGTDFVAESLVVTGLQPGMTYGYRIRVKSSYAAGDAEAVGATMTFTTVGLPTVLSTPTPLGLLAVPQTIFPPVEARPCKRGYHRAKSGKCAKNKAKHKKKGRRATNGRRGAKGAHTKGGPAGTRHRKSG